MAKTPIRKDRIHGNATVDTAEETLAELAKLPDSLRVNITRSDGRKVRGDAILRNVRKKFDLDE